MELMRLMRELFLHSSCELELTVLFTMNYIGGARSLLVFHFCKFYISRDIPNSRIDQKSHKTVENTHTNLTRESSN